MINIKHIIDGIVNTVQAKKEVEAVAHSRREICNGCQYNSENINTKFLRPDAHCTICKCNLTLKTHSLHSSCPINKWLAVATEEENDAIEDKLKENE